MLGTGLAAECCVQHSAIEPAPNKKPFDLDPEISFLSGFLTRLRDVISQHKNKQTQPHARRVASWNDIRLS